MDMTINPGLRDRRRVSANKTGIAVRKIQRKEMRLLFNATNSHHGLAEIRLGVTPLANAGTRCQAAGGMSQRHKHLAAPPTMFADIILDRRIAALERVFICYPAVDTQYRREGRSRSKIRLAVCRCLRFRLRSSCNH